MIVLQVRRTTFEGVTGNISFNELADRHTDSELWNVQLSSTGGQPSFGSVARWQAGSADFIFDDANATADTSLTWARGIVSPSAPDELTACPAGYHWDEALGFCAACKKNTYSSRTSGEKITQCESCGPGWLCIEIPHVDDQVVAHGTLGVEAVLGHEPVAYCSNFIGQDGIVVIITEMQSLWPPSVRELSHGAQYPESHQTLKDNQKRHCSLSLSLSSSP